MEEPEWLSTPAAALRLGIVPRTLYRLIDTGQLPAYKFGRVIRVREADLEALIEGAVIKPGDLAHLFPSPPDPSGASASDEDEEPGPLPDDDE